MTGIDRASVDNPVRPRIQRSVVAALVLTLVIGSILIAAGFDVSRSRPAFARAGGMAQTPPMGLLIRGPGECGASENLVTTTAELVVSSGLRAAGYQFLNLEDCWMAGRRGVDGRLMADPVTFPHGIAALADRLHRAEFRLGLYADAGATTRNGRPGSLGQEELDAQTFASWGVDYLAYDNWSSLDRVIAGQDLVRYSRMRHALAGTGHPAVFAVAQRDSAEPWTWAPQAGQLWRIGADTADRWDNVRATIRRDLPLHPYAGPGAWNDPGPLDIGGGGMTDTEYRTQLSMWSMLAAPLIIGTDLGRIPAAGLEMLTNREVIAIDQDLLGQQATLVRDDQGQMIFVKPLANGDTAVALYNETDIGAQIATSAADLRLDKAPGYLLRDVWRAVTTETAGRIQAYVPPHGTVLYRVSAGGHGARSRSATALTIEAAGTGGEGPAEQNVTVTLSNLGRLPVRTASVALSGPSGWQVTPTGPSAAAVVAPGDEFTTTWRVRTPAGIPAGPADLRALGQFSYGRRGWETVTSFGQLSAGP